MIGGLKPYPDMKHSDVPWLGEVPAHWELPRLGALLQERGETNSNGDVEEVLSVLRNRGVITYSEKGNLGNKKSEDITRYKIVRPDDIVVNCMNVIIGSVGLSRYTGCLSPVYYVLTRRSQHDHPRYLDAYFQTKPFQESLVRIGNGILAHRMRIPMELLKCEPFPRPPAEEQTAIVRFLDYADRRILHYIRAKQKLIALLEEQKQAIIHQAITGQIDVRTGQPYPAYKPSGVEWLGKVPAHWEVRRLRHLIEGKLTYGANASAEHTEPTWPRYLRITDFSKNGKLRSDTFRSLPPETAKDYLVKPGDVLLARSGATVGKAFLVDEEAGTACHAGYLIRVRPNRSLIRPAFFFAFTQSASFTRWKDSTFIIATIQNIGADKYADLPVPVPALSEQDSLLRFLDSSGAPMDHAEQCAKVEVDRLREYRTRLIADVVTGKLDVREAAAELPDVDPLAADGDLDDTFDTDTGSAFNELDVALEEAES